MSEASGRARKPTERGRAYEAEQCLANFKRFYSLWKEDAGATRRRLQEPCDEDLLEDLKFKLEEQKEMILSLEQLIDMINERYIESQESNDSATPDFVYKADVRLRLPKAANRSVFGDSSITSSEAPSAQEIEERPQQEEEIMDNANEETVNVQAEQHPTDALGTVFSSKLITTLNPVGLSTNYDHFPNNVNHVPVKLSPHAPEFTPPNPPDFLEMPRTQLPIYDGNPTRYMEYISAFEEGNWCFTAHQH
ncbi:hypothetical protein CAPTEDRAFT_216226 [Capitella teleta]|uniref:Uncharacterized protein n=1 Tax=Capitella teleta TaxID=283909 RepID=R7VAY2_CAPTE|nr:hypothetical protein CAPTEDRAFT_216226 [Capitella teleta]|eukprot:ELU13496.1 hypothetical protein CAPTEDRAFT_216226 [Capitella teleta]